MAPHADHLVEVGRDGFATLDRICNPRPMAQGSKSRNIPQQSHEAVTGTAAPYHDNVIDSKTAARKYKGVVVMEIYKRKFPGRSY